MKPVRPVISDNRKISLDDSSMLRSNKSSQNKEETAPSFATLPRKKKLNKSSDSPSKVPTPAVVHVTWMKDLAQQGKTEWLICYVYTSIVHVLNFNLASFGMHQILRLGSIRSLSLAFKKKQ